MLKFLLAFLISTASFAAQPGAVPSVTVSATGANTANVSISPAMLSGTGVNGIFSLYAYVAAGGSTAGYWLVLYKNGTAYATGSSTRAYCFDITASSSGTNSTFQLISSQAAIANNNNTALTSGVYQGGATTTYPLATSSTANTNSVIPGVYVFGNGSNATYAGIQVGSSSTGYDVHMDCYEQ